MKIVSQKFGATLSSMSIEDSKELYLKLWLLCAIWLDARLFKVQNNRDSVFIVVSNQAIVCVSTIGYHIWKQFFLRNLCPLNNWSVRKLLLLRLLLLSLGHALSQTHRRQHVLSLLLRVGGSDSRHVLGIDLALRYNSLQSVLSFVR